MRMLTVALALVLSLSAFAEPPILLTARNWYVIALDVEDPATVRRVYYTRGPNPGEQVIESNAWTSDYDRASGRLVLVIPRESTPAYVRVRDESVTIWEGWLGVDPPRRRAVRHE